MRTLDDLSQAIGSLVRDRRFALPAVFALALGVGLFLSIAGLFRVDSFDPVRLSTAIVPDYIREPGWSGGWAGQIWPPASVQALHFDRLLRVVAAVAALGFLAAAFGVGILAIIRAATRFPELALRKAMGATPRRLLAQLALEALAVAGVGSALGLVLGTLGSRLGGALWPHNLSESGVGMDPRVVLLALVVPALALAAFVLWLAASVTRRADLSGALVLGADDLGARGELILHDFLATLQLGGSMALVIAAGALMRASAPELDVSAGSITAAGAVAVQIDLPREEYMEESRRAAYYEGVLAGAHGLGDVRAETLSTPGARVGVGSLAPATTQCGRCYRGGVYVPIMGAYVSLHAVSPGFFRASGVQLLGGREFTAGDRLGAPRVMIVNRAFAESSFEAGQPLGRKVQIGGVGEPWYTVVGVVDDLPGVGVAPSRRTRPVAYVPILQDPPLSADLTLAAGGSAQDKAVELHGRIDAAGVVPGLSRPRTLRDYLAHQAAPIRWLAWVLGLVGTATLFVGMHGVHAVMRYRVTRRYRELGLHRALGAGRWRLMRGVLWQSLGLAGIGTAIGAGGALLLSGWLETLVPGLSPFDAPLYAITAATLALAAVVGALTPARRAAHTDPAAALRGE